MSGITTNGILSFGNLILSSINVILAFSLLVYILANNLRNPVARSFSSLLLLVTIVHASDVMLLNVDVASARFFWLKFQWLGLAFIPAAYLHFSDTLLRITNSFSGPRRLMVGMSYALGALLFVLVIASDLVVTDGVSLPWETYYRAGPLFWLFVVYFFLLTGWGVYNTVRARERTLTAATRRRMTYLAVSFAAPALGAFPYLLLASLPAYLPSTILLLLTLVGSTGVAIMTVVMAYSVAFHGVLAPERVVKRNLINYILRGPLVGSCLLIIMLVIPRVERILGLPRDTVLIFSVVVGIVLLQVFISALAPVINLLVYRRERAEISWIGELESRLLTTTDLEELLENILGALCDLLRVASGFVIIPREEDGWQIVASSGPRKRVEAFLGKAEGLSRVLFSKGEGEDISFIEDRGFWLLLLRTRSRQAVLGVLGVETPSRPPDLTEQETNAVRMLVSHAELALEDQQLQRGVFAVLKRIAPELQFIQRWRSIPRYVGSPALSPLEESPVYAPDFLRAVKEALDHYWGGPKLTESPLLKMGVVRKALAENGHVPVKALQTVLSRAIEVLKPPEEGRSLTDKAWILYNILEMKFVRGLRMRDIAQRLSVSESDLYRKQRVAVEAVAKVLARMEEEGA